MSPTYVQWKTPFMKKSFYEKIAQFLSTIKIFENLLINAGPQATVSLL